jgi:hypothetical protein
VKKYQREWDSQVLAAKGMCRLVVIVVMVVIECEWESKG